MKLSLICPSRNNLTYFKWMYDSVRKNQGNHEVFICAAADACTDGTVEYFAQLSEQDEYFSYLVNSGPDRLGHTILYDQIIRELVFTEIAMIWHSDMYLAPGALDAIEKYMYETVSYAHDNSITRRDPIRNRIVSLTRVEPPLHPPGPEKITRDFGTEPENFDENAFLSWVTGSGLDDAILENPSGHVRSLRTTEGVFAPWAFWVDEFKSIGGHDPLFAPQSKEDSDIFNRFALSGTKFIQTWEGFVYHMTCRGNRFNPNETAVGVNNPVWEKQNLKSSREFIRKWGHFVKHDKYMKPIIPPKYNIGLVVKNCNIDLLRELEPWCSVIYVDMNRSIIEKYIESEATSFELDKKIHPIFAMPDDNLPADIIVDIDGKDFSEHKMYLLANLATIIEQSGTIGEFDLSGMLVTISDMREHQNELIVCEAKKNYFK